MAYLLCKGCSMTKAVFMSFLRKQESREDEKSFKKQLDSRFHGNDEVAVGKNLISLRSLDYQDFVSF